MSTEYVTTERQQSFLSKVEDTRHERNIINGLAPFLDEKAPADMLGLYSSSELVQLRVLKGTDRDLEKRMPVKMTRHYFELAKTSAPIRRIVKADPAETMALAGSEDPGIQMDSWNYQTCTEFVFPSCSNGKSDMFEYEEWNNVTYSEDCQGGFGVKPKSEWPLLEYGGSLNDLKYHTNIIFSNGGYVFFLWVKVNTVVHLNLRLDLITLCVLSL